MHYAPCLIRDFTALWIVEHNAITFAPRESAADNFAARRLDTYSIAFDAIRARLVAPPTGFLPPPSACESFAGC